MTKTKNTTKQKKITKPRLKITDISALLSIILILVTAVLVIQLKNFSSSAKKASNEVSAVKNTSHSKINTTQTTATKSATTSANPKNNIPKTNALEFLQNSGRTVHIPILYYHYISENPNPKDTARNGLEVTPTHFDDQMNYLSSHAYTPITLDTLYAGLEGKQPLPPKPIVLTFDDGYVDFYINAFPILRKYNFHVVSFIPTGLMDQGYYLHWNQIQEMDSSGLVSFQAHTVSHASLPSLPLDKAIFQITEAKKVLESRLGKPVNFMAYPYGTNDGVDWQLVKQAGFLAALGTWYGETESEGLKYDWPRIKVGNWDSKRFATAF